jgi:hypothetical protein
MKLIIGSTALALLLSGASLYAQEPDKDKPKEEPKKEEAAKPAPERKQEPAKQEEKAKPEPAKQQPKPEDRNQPAHPQQTQQQQSDTRTVTKTDTRTVQHNDNQARHVPDEKFRAQIGREHHFHVARSEDRRISYGGYYFTYGEAWPSGWDYNDDVYIDYGDGQYYLIDLRHPGVRLLLVVAD